MLAVSDITGLTGMCIIRDIVSGVHDPEALVKHRDPRCAKDQDEIALSLQGNYKAEHLFQLKQALEAYDFYQGQIQGCDERIEGVYNAFEPQVDINEKPLPRKKAVPWVIKPEPEATTVLYANIGGFFGEEIVLAEYDEVVSFELALSLNPLDTYPISAPGAPSKTRNISTTWGEMKAGY